MVTTLPDYLDIDKDNDGIFDVVEGGDGASDTNGDGIRIIDSNDTGYADADGDDGMSDNTEDYYRARIVMEMADRRLS